MVRMCQQTLLHLLEVCREIGVLSFVCMAQIAWLALFVPLSFIVITCSLYFYKIKDLATPKQPKISTKPPQIKPWEMCKG